MGRQSVRACLLQPTDAHRRLARARRAGRARWCRRARRRGARRTRWGRRTGRAGRSRRAGRSCGCGTRKAWSFATPVGHIFRVLLERWRATVPRRKVGPGVEQIAGNQDLLAFLGVAHTLHRLTRRHRWIGMSGDGDDDRHRQRGEHPNNKAIDHEHSFMQSLCRVANRRSVATVAKRRSRAPAPSLVCLFAPALH